MRQRGFCGLLTKLHTIFLASLCSATLPFYLTRNVSSEPGCSTATTILVHLAPEGVPVRKKGLRRLAVHCLLEGMLLPRYLLFDYTGLTWCFSTLGRMEEPQWDGQPLLDHLFLKRCRVAAIPGCCDQRRARITAIHLATCE